MDDQNDGIPFIPLPFAAPQPARVIVEEFRGLPQVVVSLRCVVVVFALINFSSHSVPQTHDRKKGLLRSLKKQSLLKRQILQRWLGWAPITLAGHNILVQMQGELRGKIILILALSFYSSIQTGNLNVTSVLLACRKKE